MCRNSKEIFRKIDFCFDDFDQRIAPAVETEKSFSDEFDKNRGRNIILKNWPRHPYASEAKQSTPIIFI